ncbi:MAG TPA: hypothetical protein VFV19_16630 [Candidatus Polarisedimenticolaceae bacterium]|nr:hypothetical protein [Candidatus Polarisedimenticolaceae bacterium]
MSARRIWIARGLAVAADVIQIGLAPLFLEGGLSVFDLTLDVLMAVVLTSLVGWHWTFLPTFAAELVPGLDLVPSWTLAVFLATRRRAPPETIRHGGRVLDVEPIRERPQDESG